MWFIDFISFVSVNFCESLSLTPSFVFEKERVSEWEEWLLGDGENRVFHLCLNLTVCCRHFSLTDFHYSPFTTAAIWYVNVNEYSTYFIRRVACSGIIRATIIAGFDSKVNVKPLLNIPTLLCARRTTANCLNYSVFFIHSPKFFSTFIDVVIWRFCRKNTWNRKCGCRCK